LAGAPQRELFTPALRLTLAAAITMAAFLLRQGLQQRFGIILPPYITFYPTVMAIALFFGLWPGILATLSATLITDYWILQPVHSLSIASTSDSVALAMFFFICVAICVVCERTRSFRLRLNALRQADALQGSETRYRTIFQTSIDAIVITRSGDGLVIDANQAFLDITGFQIEEVLGKTVQELSLWTNQQDHENLFEPLRLASQSRELQVQLQRKNGERFWGLISGAAIEIEGEACILSIFRDITAARMAEEEIRTLAFYDPLTGLANRRLLMERLGKSIRASSRSQHKRALLFVDLDNFKTLNDTLGHQTGDLMLKEVGKRLSTCVREVDTVGRLGGDEFVIMLEELSGVEEEAAAQSKAIAEKLLTKVGQPYLLDGHACSSTCSIGITIFGGHHENINEVLQQADIAMYQAKAVGRNTLRFFAPALQAAVSSRAAMEKDLRQGVKQKQFALFYQPQVENGQIVRAEALLRWKHPRRGILLPEEFLPLAEETRLILPLSDWVLESACRQIAAWSGQEATSGITVTVNISALQLRQADFVDSVLATLKRCKANPRRLELEITESMLIDNIEEVLVKMSLLREQGLRFSVDDFGTGYSSLASLKRLPLDQLKIDSSFIHDIMDNEDTSTIAQTILSMGQSMHLSVIAEGVETEHQREVLANLGCHAYQGYLYSQPLPPEEFVKMLGRFNENQMPSIA
jgi:diguanylate cyclase (GGDEF)-like protein/PAS domain S-box-containing protein